MTKKPSKAFRMNYFFDILNIIITLITSAIIKLQTIYF